MIFLCNSPQGMVTFSVINPCGVVTVIKLVVINVVTKNVLEQSTHHNSPTCLLHTSFQVLPGCQVRLPCCVCVSERKNKVKCCDGGKICADTFNMSWHDENEGMLKEQKRIAGYS